MLAPIYDALGRVVGAITALGFRTTSIFDADGLKIAIIDARGNRTSFTYDAAAAQTQRIDALNRRTTYAYDIAGQQALRIDARSNRTTYAYSSRGQLTARKYPNGSRSSFAYDANGKRTLSADGTGRYTYIYDSLMQAVGVKLPDNKRLTYSYDEVGNRRSLDATDAGRFTYTYEAGNRLRTLRNPFGERTTYAYDTAGRRTVTRSANGICTLIVYDAASQITQKHSRTSAGLPIIMFDYRYDAAANRTGVLENSGARVTWVYDSDGRLIAERRSGTNSYAQTFAYDAAGNRTLKNVDAVRTTYSYDAANQLRYGQATAGRTTYLYDSAGNQQVERPPVGARTTTTWDYENRPTQYQLSTAQRVTMSYNSDSRRMTKQSASGTVKFIWDPVTDAYLEELDGSNVIQAVYTQEPTQFGGLASQRRGSASNFFHTDAIGSTRALSDSTQVVTDAYLYDAWGNSVASTGTTVNSFRWGGNVGYHFDQALGTYYIRARTYQPIAARWTSLDPLIANLSVMSSFTSADRTGRAFVGYVFVRPVSRVDPSGLWETPLVDLHPDGLIEMPPGYFDEQYYAIFGCHATNMLNKGCMGAVQDLVGRVDVIDSNTECFYFADFAKTKLAAERAFKNKKCDCLTFPIMFAYNHFTRGMGARACKGCGRVDSPEFPPHSLDGPDSPNETGSPQFDSCVRTSIDGPWLGATEAGGSSLIWPNVDAFKDHYRCYDTAVICVTCSSKTYPRPATIPHMVEAFVCAWADWLEPGIPHHVKPCCGPVPPEYIEKMSKPWCQRESRNPYSDSW